MKTTQSEFGVYIVEDDPHTRARLVDAVHTDTRLTVIGQAGKLSDVMEDWADVSLARAVLIDLGLPDGDGVDLIAKLSQLPEPPSLLVISVFGDERHVIRAIEAGAVGYLLKDSDEETLADSIVRTINGECPINPSIARHLLKRFQPSHASEVPLKSPITPRETEVLTLIARGYGNPEIANLLKMSTNTVTTHTKAIYRKLAVNSRSEAVFEAAQMGIIDMHKPSK